MLSGTEDFSVAPIEIENHVSDKIKNKDLNINTSNEKQAVTEIFAKAENHILRNENQDNGNKEIISEHNPRHENIKHPDTINRNSEKDDPVYKNTLKIGRAHV